jgi:hypothetical protein
MKALATFVLMLWAVLAGVVLGSLVMVLVWL